MKTIDFKRNLKKSLRAAPGFTLLEVVIAVAVLSLLSGTIYSVIHGCIQIAVQAQTVEQEKARMEQFTSLLRRSIMSMPDGAKLKLTLIDGTSSLQQEFSLEGSADFFPFGERAISRSKTIFSLQPSANAEDGTPRYALSMWRSDMIQVDKEDDEGETAQEVRPSHLVPDEKGRYWLPLIDNISSWEWGFWNSEDEKWEQEWENEENPSLIEMKVTLGGQTVPTRNVFTVYQMPKITVAKPTEESTGAQDSQSLASNANGGGNGNNPNGSGGRGQGGRDGNKGGRGNRDGNGGRDGGMDSLPDGEAPPEPRFPPPGFSGGPPGQGGGNGEGNGGGRGRPGGGGRGNGQGNRGGSSGGGVMVR